jgi:pimeloyl-ACP methyl ester carboxylesterase
VRNLPGQFIIAFFCLSLNLPLAGPVTALPLVGSTVAPSIQLQGVAAFHRAGQTFITWRELDPVPQEVLTIAQLRTLRRELVVVKRIRYRVYRSERPIQKIADGQVVGEVLPLSVWDSESFGINPSGGARPPRYVIEEGKPPLPAGTGLFVHNPPRAERAYYVVTVSVAGNENTAVTAENMTTAAVTEAVGVGIPVLQRVENPTEFQYVRNPSLRYYVRWEPPENSSVPGRPFDYLVAIPPGVRYPAPIGIHLHCWGGSMRGCYGWWYNARKGTILVSSNDNPYDWWTGYHERFDNRGPIAREQARNGVVRPYTQRRLLSFVEWLGTTMRIDLSRLFTAGSSMGGAGAIMLAIRYPDRIAWATSWVGVHVPSQSPQFKSSYELVYGKPEWDVRFEDGTPVWNYFDDVWYLRSHPQQDVGFITFSNGKNDGAIGWPQAVEFFRALQDTRQPHLFVWGQQGHAQRAIMPAGGRESEMPLDLRTNQSLPAFTRGTLDDDPGTGAVGSGAPKGQVNAYLTWDTNTIIDEPGRWAMTVKLIPAAPQPASTVDVTPRRLQQLKLRAGDRVDWTNTLVGGVITQSGEVIADQGGLVTLPQVQISKDGNRIAVSRK